MNQRLLGVLERLLPTRPYLAIVQWHCRGLVVKDWRKGNIPTKVALDMLATMRHIQRLFQ